MQCRSCSAEIADKAIVCYRCGTPTADLGTANPARTAAGRRRWWPAALVVAIVVAVGAYFLLLR